MRMSGAIGHRVAFPQFTKLGSKLCLFTLEIGVLTEIQRTRLSAKTPRQSDVHFLHPRQNLRRYEDANALCCPYVTANIMALCRQFGANSCSALEDLDKVSLRATHLPTRRWAPTSVSSRRCSQCHPQRPNRSCCHVVAVCHHVSWRPFFFSDAH